MSDYNSYDGIIMNDFNCLLYKLYFPFLYAEQMALL